MSSLLRWTRVQTVSWVLVLAASSTLGAETTATTVGDLKIPTETLRLLVRPMTQDELTVEAEQWLDILQDQVREISRAEIELRDIRAATQESDPTAEQTARIDGLLESLNTLREEKIRRVDRLAIIVQELRRKGAPDETTAPFDSYLAAVRSPHVNPSDYQAALKATQGWLLSPEGGARWAQNVAVFGMILVGFYFASRFAQRATRRALDRRPGSSELLRTFLSGAMGRAVLVVGGLVALAALEIDIAPVVAVLAGASFAVALALQGTLSNFASGLMILLYRPFDIGDAVDVAGVSGKVEGMSLVSTLVRTFDNKAMLVPNNDVWSNIIVNATATDTRRVDLVFGIAYDDDTAKAQEVLERVVREHPKVLKEPAPTIRLHELADSSVNFICRPWVATDDYWDVYWDVTGRVKEEFDRNGISIPFPQRDVHVYNASSGS